PVVSDALSPRAVCALGFAAGVIFSAGAFCCAAGARVGASSFFTSCADAAPTASKNVAATVDNSLALFIQISCGHLPNVFDVVECIIGNVPRTRKFQNHFQYAVRPDMGAESQLMHYRLVFTDSFL